MNIRQIILTAVFLLLFAISGTGLVSFTHEATRERIAENERLALLRSLHQLITPERHDNKLFHDAIQVRDRRLDIQDPVAVYRARMKDEPVALVLSPVAPDGYSGRIKLLVGINYDGSLTGVRAVTHHETPGLGDAIEAERSDWVLGFDGRSIGDPDIEGWGVKKDGGIYDQFTGATITPRAVVKAVRNSLLYYNENRELLFRAYERREEEPGDKPQQ